MIAVEVRLVPLVHPGILLAWSGPGFIPGIGILAAEPISAVAEMQGGV